MKLVDAATIQAVDRKAIAEYGLTGLQLMENAGRGVAVTVASDVEERGFPKKVSIIAGKGNNGGDGFVAARHLKNMGYAVKVFSLARIGDIKGDAGLNANAWRKMGGDTVSILSSEGLKEAESAIRHSSIIVDAIFGTGLSSNVEGLYFEVIGFINSLNKRVIAVDMPSGIDATTGKVLGIAVKADKTVTMALPKLGHYLYPGRSYSGKVEIIDIGVPRALLEADTIKWNLITETFLRRTLKVRDSDSHKTTHGHVLVLAGSPGMTGAAYMAAMGAMRAGAGLVSVGAPESMVSVIASKTTEVMVKALPENEDKSLGAVSFESIKEIIEKKAALIFGPGLAVSADTLKLAERIIKEVELPVIIDAGALSSIGSRTDIFKGAKAKVIITPHPGEAARLLGVSTDDVQADRVNSALRLADVTGATVVLKGAISIVTDPAGEFFLNPTGNPGLATAGTGDILSGIIGGLLAQGYMPRDASVAGVYIHGLSGDEVKKDSGEVGMVATDLLPKIPKVINGLIPDSGA